VTKIIAFDIDPGRVEFAKTYGADVALVVPTNKESKGPLDFAKDYINSVKEQYGLGHGVDVAVDASGAESSMQMSVVITKPYGTCEQHLSI
jgi:D-xylulose reductase